jgi:hypothetical protein
LIHIRSISDGIYSRFEGAVFKNVSLTGPVWTLPCDVEVNITVVLGGQRYPLHPLDTNLDLGFKDDNGQSYCIGSVSLEFSLVTT